MEKTIRLFMVLGAAATLFAAPVAQAATHDDHDMHADPFVVTATNASPNQLLVYDKSGNLLQTLATGGNGAASGNAGGVEAQDDMVAVINYASQSVSIFDRDHSGYSLAQEFSTLSKPVSVAFDEDHLYVLGATTVESHKIKDSGHVAQNADGSAKLFAADGTAAQVGVVDDQLLITEKSGVVETVKLQDGKVSGSPAMVSIPAGSDTPLGLVTRDNVGYVTIAHSDEIGLFKNGNLTNITSSGTQHAPCWLTLTGSFLYSSNSPSKSISLYKVTNHSISQQIAVAASLSGAPTDISSDDRNVAVIDGTDLSVFKIADDGSLSLVSSTATGSSVNGVAIVR